MGAMLLQLKKREMMKTKILDVIKKASLMAMKYEDKINTLAIDDKKGEGIATEADLALEKFISEELRKIEDIDVLGEESFFLSGKKDFEEFKEKRLWVIDPIDGTNNFVNQIPFYSISVALVDKGIPQFGVVHNPRYGETFYAIKGEGAFYTRDINTQASKINSPENVKKISECIVSLGALARKRDDLGRENFMKVLKKTRAIRKFGSAALDMCYVSLNRIDIYSENNLKPWDTAAALLVCEEAGIKVTDFSYQEFSIFQDQVLAIREPLFSSFQSFLQD
jgi:myo-inositol-1(or 4)-monophosphatase